MSQLRGTGRPVPDWPCTWQVQEALGTCCQAQDVLQNVTVAWSVSVPETSLLSLSPEIRCSVDASARATMRRVQEGAYLFNEDAANCITNQPIRASLLGSINA